MTKNKGIHDPWRMGTPDWEPPPEEKPAGAKGSKLPFDWDLQPEQTFVLRYQGVSLKVIGANTAEGAAAVILRAFLMDSEVRQILTDAGFEHHEDGGGSGFVLKVQGQTLACPSATDTRDGLFRLSTALRQAMRADRSMKGRLIKLGIVPLIQ
jgi:hypothetical protein